MDPSVRALVGEVEWLVDELDSALARERKMRRAIEASCECPCGWCGDCIERLSVFRRDCD